MAVAAPSAPMVTGPPATTQALGQNGPDTNAPGYANAPAQVPAPTQNVPLPTSLGSNAPVQGPDGTIVDPATGKIIPQTTIVQPPPGQGPNFMTPAMQQYVNQFQQSQAAQRQAIDAGLVQALSGLGSRRDAAASVAAGMPGEFAKTYAEATQNQGTNAGIAGGAFAGPTQGGNADDSLISQSNAAEKGSGVGAQGLLQAGINADYSKGATALQNEHMQNEADVAQQQQAFDQSMIQAQAGYQQANSSQQAGFAHDIAMAKLTDPTAGLTLQQKSDAANQANLDSQATAVGFHNYAQLQSVSSDPFYRAIEQAIVTGKTQHLPDGTGVHGNRQALINQAASSNYDVIRALLANHVINASDVANLGK